MTLYNYRISSIKRPVVYFFLAAYLPGGLFTRRLLETGAILRQAFIFTCIKFALHLTHIVLAHMASLGSDYYEKASVVNGHHVYKAVWTPFICEELLIQPKDQNDQVK